MDAVDALSCAALLAVMLVSVPANALVLACFACSPEIRRQAPALFTLSLALCDLLLSVSSVPLTLAVLITGRRAPDTSTITTITTTTSTGGTGTGASSGGGGCRALGALETLLSAGAMLSTAALSVDRWLAVVVSPLRYRSRMRRRHAAGALACAWAHAACFSAAAACRSWVGYHRLYAACTLREEEPQQQEEEEEEAAAVDAPARAHFATFTVAFHVLTFALSLAVLCVTYRGVLRVARVHCRRIDVITMQTLVLLVDIHPSVRQRCLEEQRRRRQRATRKISTFIGTFVLCFGPYVITRILELWPGVHISEQWGVLCKCLSYSKAACDPFIYSLLRHQYRKTCSDLLNRLLKRTSLNSTEWQRTNGPSTVLQTIDLNRERTEKDGAP
ncbi:G-protein coupled receptor 26 [Astyanax mexicanus]|uniref:G protein-coupled receptor 26 n=2 Tax=Astyanax mexicanus TaxID=7994 RepID=W5K9U4_ASTMX|nr:G-protein coupled receptor 26 [Astyanax mexicanus]KAG9267514.1 G-protein coupled receptor 26-like [Astyanax mexicanus]